MDKPYASPSASPILPTQVEQAWSTHRSRVDWLGLWSALCGLAGLLLTAFVGLVATEVSPIGLTLWSLFWLARTLAGIGMLKRKVWGRWLGVLVHVLLCMSGVASVVGGFGLWVLLSDLGSQVFDPEVEPSMLPPKHRKRFGALLALLVLLNWAVPLYVLVFVLGPMV